MSQQTDRPGSRQQWSELMDGEADDGCAARLCAAWRSDAEARAAWHAWHLVGDVLRSDELASQPRRDAAFLTALRRRLAAEPVVLAPAPAPAARRRWPAAIAVAGGFAVVIGTAVVLNLGSRPEAAPVLAQSPAPAVRQAAAPLPALPADPQFVNASGQLIRDARLDRYLAAHKPAGSNVVPVIASGFVAPRAADAAR